ncbi:hypothetical protein FOL47_003894 [Perkinsus chesapeaki]|uniref:EF-hand domain-containing protein n=1 Tax=Perkinsus chesapeaki TaxID=330153 RepID=A0A7J6M6X3_PERCH|nr:hypothetical protein FOL47_003894 [Perkinsus chesapeaki]
MAVASLAATKHSPKRKCQKGWQTQTVENFSATDGHYSSRLSTDRLSASSNHFRNTVNLPSIGKGFLRNDATIRQNVTTSPLKEQRRLEGIYRIGNHLPVIKQHKRKMARRELETSLRRTQAELKVRAREYNDMMDECEVIRNRLKKMTHRKPPRLGVPFKELGRHQLHAGTGHVPKTTTVSSNCSVITDFSTTTAENDKCAAMIASSVAATVCDGAIKGHFITADELGKCLKQTEPREVTTAEAKDALQRLREESNSIITKMARLIDEMEHGVKPVEDFSTTAIVDPPEKNTDFNSDSHSQFSGRLHLPPLPLNPAHRPAPKKGDAHPPKPPVLVAPAPTVERSAITDTPVAKGSEWRIMSPTGQLVSIEHLKHKSPRTALREALIIACGSVEKAYRRMDLNDNGDLSTHELEDGLNRLKIPWHLISGGMSIRQVFKLFDLNSSGDVDIKELVGCKYTPRPKWQEMTQENQWKFYCNRVAAIIEERHALESNPRAPRPFQYPHWYAQTSDEEFYRMMENVKSAEDLDARKRWVKLLLRQGVHALETLAAHLPRNLNDPVAVARAQKEEVEGIAASGRRIEKAVREFGSQRRQMQNIRVELSNVTEADSRRAEMKRKREEEEAARREMLQQINGGESLLPKRVECEMFRPPRPEELQDYFSERALLCTPEQQFRRMARALRVPIPDAEAIQKQFNKFDTDDSGEIDRDEFHSLVVELMGLKSKRQDLLPKSRLEQFWLSVEKNSNGAVGFREFLSWYHGTMGPPRAQITTAKASISQ